ncbi:response regulator transcription factor [Actinocatenispora rupis]|uniref:Sensory transduction protein RegX3 n=1 Tax=Actinocatenispora rupis TaxID=519421 RepID=A0A8J3J6F7_9ACTN|nr:response regulator transcription factor [Actinocatenispora rupis]GID10944.1 DNA-binding response regulator [Actinocatenispora rupis]
MDILVVEDDVRLADALCGSLRRSGYEVLHVRSGGAALAAPPCDLVLLDLGLPDGDGLDICGTLKERTGAAVIAVTARGTEPNRVRGLRTGADDYVVKPFGMSELLARIEAVMRRHRPPRGGVLRVGRLAVDLDAREAAVDGTLLTLSRKEFDLVAALVRHQGEVVGREQLLTDVWRYQWAGGARTLEVHVAGLRAKLSGVVRIDASRGVGYRLLPADGAAETAS